MTPLEAVPIHLSDPQSLQGPSLTDRILADCSEDRFGGLRETIAAEVIAYATESRTL
jgi:hypothetical protein